jgi:outer membrane protein assembly factor BamB
MREVSYLPPPQSRSRQVRERYRKARRRQLAIFSIAVFLFLVLVALIVTAAVLLRGCVQRPGQLAPKPRPASRTALPKLAGTVNLKSVWFVYLDDKAVYAACDTKGRESGYPNYPLDLLAAYPLTGGKSLWQVQLDTQVYMLTAAQGQLLCFSQYLSEPPRAELTAYNAADGASSWSQRIDGATHSGFCADGKVALLGYQQSDGARLCAFNIERGAKAWGMKLPLKGLQRGLLDTEATGSFELFGAGGLSVYHFLNVVGVVQSEKGKLLREYAAPGFIRTTELDSTARICYLLTSGQEANSYAVQALPVSGGSAVNLVRFSSPDAEGTLLLAEGGRLLVSYVDTPTAGGAPACMVAGYKSGHEGPLFAQRLEGGVISDISALPGAPGDYLIAVNDSVDETRLPQGAGRLLRLNGATGATQEVARLKVPVLYLVPFKQQCLVLTRGGDIYSYDPASAMLRRFKHAAYPLLAALLSADGQRLLVYSVPEATDSNAPFASVQVLLFE